MNKEQFKILKEINSLLLKIKEIDLNIESENSRVTKIINLREEKKSHHLKLQDELVAIQKDIDLNEKKLKEIAKIKETSEKSSHLIKNESEAEKFSLQQKKLNDDISSAEDLIFSLLQRFDDIQNEISETALFLEGSLITLNDIKKEVLEINEPLLKEIEKLKVRIEYLKGELSQNFKTKLESTLNKNLKNSPFTRIISSYCEHCKLLVSKIDEEAIERNLSLKSCSGCSRIFIPREANY